MGRNSMPTTWHAFLYWHLLLVLCHTMGFQWVLQFTTAVLTQNILSPQRTPNNVWRHFGVSHLIGTELRHQWRKHCWQSTSYNSVYTRQPITNKTHLCKIEQVSRSKLYTYGIYQNFLNSRIMSHGRSPYVNGEEFSTHQVKGAVNWAVAENYIISKE